jgi:hypothetical protein
MPEQSPTDIIALWSPPRARSTAFYRAMLERGDLVALHEPFCNLVDYGETQIADELVRSPADLIAAMRRLARHRTVFFKDTTDYRYEAVLADHRFLADARHTFLLRRPDEVAASFYAIRPDMSRAQLGFEHMYQIYAAVLDAGGPRPVIVDSDDLVARPTETIAAYCRAVGIPFLPDALHWRPGARPEWQRSERWHQDVSDSSGIEPRERGYSDTVATNPALAAYSDHHRPFYDLLHAERLPI